MSLRSYRARKRKVGGRCYRQARRPPVAGDAKRFGHHRVGHRSGHQTRCSAIPGPRLRLVRLRAHGNFLCGSRFVRVRFRNRNGWWSLKCHRPVRRVQPDAHRSNQLGSDGIRGHWDAPMSVSTCGKKKGYPRHPLTDLFPARPRIHWADVSLAVASIKMIVARSRQGCAGQLLVSGQSSPGFGPGLSSGGGWIQPATSSRIRWETMPHARARTTGPHRPARKLTAKTAAIAGAEWNSRNRSIPIRGQRGWRRPENGDR